VDLLDDQGTSMSVAGTFVPSPSPRRNTQSPETHQLQQTLRNSASELVRTYSSSSDSGDGASTFASLQASNTSAIVETVQEGRSDDDEEWPEVNLGPRLSDAHNDASSMYDSGLQELIIDTEDPVEIKSQSCKQFYLEGVHCSVVNDYNGIDMTRRLGV